MTLGFAKITPEKSSKLKIPNQEDVNVTINIPFTYCSASCYEFFTLYESMTICGGHGKSFPLSSLLFICSTNHPSLSSFPTTLFMKQTLQNSMESFEIFGVCILFLSLISVSSTLDMITPTQPIRDGKNENGTLVSTNGTFEAGFFSQENSNNRYLGIWYKNISPRAVVWVANREAPLKDHSGVLEVDSDQGILSLKDSTGAKIWSSNASTSNTPKEPVVVLLFESGNMVMNDGHNNLLWQSFDYPDDTLLPGMKLGKDFKTGRNRALRSWKSLIDPTPGKFSFGVDTRGLPQLVIKSNNNIVYRPGSWNGISVTGLPEEITDQFTKSLFVINQHEVFYEIQLLNSSTILRSRLTPEGYQVRLIWSDQNKKWDIQYPGSFDACESYALCGANTICNSGTAQHCECLRGFKANSGDSTCARTTPLDCSKGDTFQKYVGMKLPDTSSSWYDKTISLQECQKLCLTNCSCNAYAQLNISGTGSGCLHWFSDIFDIRTLSEGGQDFYLKMSAVTASELQGIVYFPILSSINLLLFHSKLCHAGSGTLIGFFTRAKFKNGAY